MPIFLPLRSAAVLMPRARLRDHDRRERAVDRGRVDDRDALADGGDDRGAVAVADVDRALAEERDEVRVDLVLERHVEAGVRVVAGLLGEVELRELDARDVAEADRERRPARGRGDGAAGRGRCERGAADAAPTADGDGPTRRPPQAATASGEAPGLSAASAAATAGTRARWTSWAAMATRSSLADQPALDEDHDEVEAPRPISASVSRAANMSGMSNREPRAMLIRTPRPCSPPAHSPTIAPMTASVTPTRMPPRIAGSAAGTSTRVIDLPARRPGSCGAISSRRGSTDRMPTIVATATGKKTISVQMTSLRRQAGAEPEGDERRQGEDGRRLGGDEVRAEQPLGEAASGRGTMPDDERDDRARSRSPAGPRPACVRTCGHIVPSAQARTKRSSHGVRARAG